MQTWDTWESFVADLEVRLLGLQALPSVPEASVLIFEHRCGSTVSVLTKRLHHLLPDDSSADLPSLYGTEECALHCFSLADHSKCDLPCSLSRDREILALVEEITASR